jgi:hypothetical protein
MKLPFAALLLIVGMMTSHPVLAHRLIDANEEVSVANSVLTLRPEIDWNRIDRRPGSDAERWTLDGELLNDVLFFGELQDEDTLFREVDRRNSPMPEFSDTMLLIDVPDFYETSLRITKGLSSFEVLSVEPMDFLGERGVRFEFETLGSDDIRRKGIAVAAIVGRKLFMMTYEAPKVFFYERNLGDFEQLVQSARLD